MKLQRITFIWERVTPQSIKHFIMTEQLGRRKGALAVDASDSIIYPDEAFILAHHNAPAVDLVFEGVALTVNSFAYLPDFNDTFLMNNPFGTDMMLSDLIAAETLPLTLTTLINGMLIHQTKKPIMWK